jgi:hypothetical protein
VVGDHPQDYAQLCLQHNPRACFAVNGTIHILDIDDVIRQYPESWSKAADQTVLAAMRDVCLNQKTVADHAGYCDAMETMTYEMVSVFGSEQQDLRRCLAVSPTSSASQKVYVDRYGNRSYGSVEHQITGNDLQNICAFAVE